MVRKLLIALLFIAGVSLFFFPMISHWKNTKVHYTVMSNHNNELEEMSEDERNEQLKKANEYNESIHADGIPIQDPFSGRGDDQFAVGYFNIMQIGETMGQIEIPSINVHLPIYHGIGERALSQGVGHMSNSSLPVGGLGTHSALTAHRGLPSTKLFRNLDQVEEGEMFFVHSLGETLAYRVDDIQVVLPSETDWLDINDDKDYVTLITCEPYMINTHRLLVRGERVPYDESLKEKRSDFAMKQNEKLHKTGKVDKNSLDMHTVVLSSVTFGVIAFCGILFFYKRRRQS